MAILRITVDRDERVIRFEPGASLREILADNGLPVRSGCGGVGSCGLCRVHIESGEVPPPTATELRRLRPEQILDGIRLACQARPAGDLRMTMENTPPCPTWQIPANGNNAAAPIAPGQRREGTLPLGLAVDLGTTRIRISLLDISTGMRLASRIGPNPQAVFGSDVMTRLTSACESRQRAAEIGRLAREAIGEALADISRIEGYPSERIERVVIVGNSAMLGLLAESNYELLLNPAYWTAAIDCHPEETDSWRRLWRIADRASVELVPPLGGFVGSDLLAGVLATRLTGKPESSLLIDFGTNSEIAVWDGTTLWTTAAAGGPAFEGCGVSCGMPAEQGAIHKVAPQYRPDGLQCEVIGNGRAEGICGSGLVDIIANLRRAAILNAMGRFVQDMPREGFAILKGRDDLKVSARDIDAFQRAKAAIGAGIRTVMGKASLHPEELQRVCVGGAFGSYLDTENAKEIGLLPQVPADRVELCGNTALAGCELLLAGKDRYTAIDGIRQTARVVNLAQTPEFEELFITGLSLRPMPQGIR